MHLILRSSQWRFRDIYSTFIAFMLSLNRIKIKYNEILKCTNIYTPTTRIHMCLFQKYICAASKYGVLESSTCSYLYFTFDSEKKKSCILKNIMTQIRMTNLFQISNQYSKKFTLLVSLKFINFY